MAKPSRDDHSPKAPAPKPPNGAPALPKSKRPPAEIMNSIMTGWKEEGASEKDGSLTFERAEFKDLLNGNKSLVIGRKGSGKTVALTYVERAVTGCKAGGLLHPSFKLREEHRPIFIKLDASEISLTRLADVATETAQVNAFWRNMIYGVVLKHLINLSNDTGQILTYHLGELFQTLIGAGIRAKAFGVDVELGGQGDDWSARAHRTAETLKTVANAMRGPIKIFVGIDKLDGALNNAMTPTMHTTYNELLAGVMDAVAHIRSSGASLGRNLTILPVASVRSDLLRRTGRADSHKWLGDDLAVNLNWSESEIKEMLAQRISNATGLNREMFVTPSGSVDRGRWFNANWEAVFHRGDIHDDYEPNGGRTRTKFDFITSRTMDSPRDYTVQIATYAQESINRGGDLITKEMMKDSFHQYAQRTLSRVTSEAVGSVADMANRFTQIYALLSSARADKRRFKQGEVTSALKVATADQLMNELFLLNVLGNYIEGETGHRYRFAYKETGPYAPGLNLHNDIVFHPTVYRGLRAN